MPSQTARLPHPCRFFFQSAASNPLLFYTQHSHVLCFSIHPTAPMGKMWWIPCSDWLPERVRRAHLVRSISLALIPRRKTIALNGLTRLAIFSQCRRWSRKKAKNKENIKQLLWVYCVRNKRVILDSYYIKVFLLSNKSFSYQAFSVEMIGHYPRFFSFFFALPMSSHLDLMHVYCIFGSMLLSEQLRTLSFPPLT